MKMTRRDAIITATAAAVSGEAAAQSKRPATHALLGQPAPAFDLPKLGGGRATLSDYRGKTLVIEFYGQWCPDCVKDGPHVAALVRAMKDDPRLAFLGIHTRSNFGRWGGVPTYFKEMGWSFPVAFDTDSATYKTYEMQWVPGYLIIDRKGVIQGFSNDLDAGGGKGVAGFLKEVRAVASRTA